MLYSPLLQPIFRTSRGHADAYLLVDAKAQGGLGYVEHDAGAAVVVLEGHTLVDGRVTLDVDVVSPLQAQGRSQYIGQGFSRAKLMETNRELADRIDVPDFSYS